MDLCKRVNRFIKNNCILPQEILIDDNIKKVMYDNDNSLLISNIDYLNQRCRL